MGEGTASYEDHGFSLPWSWVKSKEKDVVFCRLVQSEIYDVRISLVDGGDVVEMPMEEEENIKIKL